MMKRILLFSLITFSCSVENNQLIGAWQAVAFYEMGQQIHTPLDSVRLSFSPTGSYRFNSLGLYAEEGSYRLAGRYLFMRDTTVHPVVERAVKVQYLSADSLKIGMELNGKQQVVFFSRWQQPR